MPSDEQNVVPLLAELAKPSWRDPMLLGPLLVIVGLLGYQLGVTLLRPPWLSLSSMWLLVVLAWLAVVLMALFSGWASGVHLPARRSWWLATAGLGCYALSRTFQLIGILRLAGHVPFPWWSDLFHLLAFPCFFLAVLFQPSAPLFRSKEGLARLRLFFDSLLLMGAVTFITWEFLLQEIPRQSSPWFPQKITLLAYPIADLGLLFLLMWLVLQGKRPLAERAVLGLLFVAFTCFIVGNSWFAALLLSHHEQEGDPSDLFFLLAILCFPLAALVKFLLARNEPIIVAGPVMQAGLSLQRQDVWEGLQFLLPFGAAVLASMVLLFRALLDSRTGSDPLEALLLSALLQGLVLLRQGVVWLEQAQVRREQQAARAREQALRETNQRMELFLMIASHELRTPLTSMLLGMQWLHHHLQHLLRSLTQDPQDAVPQVEKMQALVGTTLQQGGRLNRLVQELLETSSIQAGLFELRLKPTDVAAIVRGAVQEERLLVPERTLLLELPIEGTVLVSADGERLGQVVTNFLTNALKYSPADRPVAVGLELEEGQVRVWVRDQGPGIALDEQGRIWERFHRAPGIEVQSGSDVGLGVGLYLSKTIIEQHEGRVGVQSALGAGSTFWFTLPLALVEPE